MKQQRKAGELHNVRITDTFWSARQRLMTDVAIPHMESILRDEAPGAMKSHAIANFRIAAGQEDGEYSGVVFLDSDVAKWLEAASYALAIKPNPELDARMDDVIDTIAKAQAEDGYLNTYFTLAEPGKRWTNLLECHELYCAGHMIEAGVAHFEATGKTNLLTVVRKLADHIVDQFGEGKRDGVPGHQEIEIALMRLYQVTGDGRYRDMARRFLDLRGQDPAYFEKNTPSHEGTKYGDYTIDPSDTVYNQSDMPVRKQTHPRGHAVRMMYMLTAMADVARECGDEEMADACRRMFDAITERQMYVTGALGSTAHHEAFTKDWHLPADTVYGETCASVAMTFFARNMLQLEPDGRYADVLEREIYNGALSGMQLDGRRYFYVNPLEVDETIAGAVPGYQHVLPQRPSWYGCACCPPNLARMITSLGKYLWSEDAETLYSHLFVGNEADMALAKVSLETNYPLQGGAVYTISPKTEKPFTLAIHMPAYIKDFELTVNGQTACGELKKGYLYLTRSWHEGDKVALSFALIPRRIYGNPRVRDCAGRVALARGPIIYCFESIDHAGVPMHTLRLPQDAAITEAASDDERLGGVIMLCAEGCRESMDDILYGDEAPRTEKVMLKAIPYFAWANRGLSSMLVWIRC